MKRKQKKNVNVTHKLMTVSYTHLIILLLIVGVLIVLPLAYYNGHGEDDGYFGGSDDAGGDAITENNPDYQVWAEPLWEPPSGCLLYTSY